MTIERFSISLFLVALCFASADALGSEPEENGMQRLQAIIADNMTDAERFDTHGFEVQSSRNNELGIDLKPNGHQFDSLMISADDIFNVAVEKGRPLSSGGAVGILHRDSGASMLSAGDQNGDGRLDILTYAVLNEEGSVVREVVDYDADGQADLRVHFDQAYAELWHRDRWYRVENREDRRGIVVEGEFITVRNVDNRLSVD